MKKEREENEANVRVVHVLEHLGDGVADEGDGCRELKPMFVFCSILVVCCWWDVWLRWEAFRCSSNSSFCGGWGSTRRGGRVEGERESVHKWRGVVWCGVVCSFSLYCDRSIAKIFDWV